MKTRKKRSSKAVEIEGLRQSNKIMYQINMTSIGETSKLLSLFVPAKASTRSLAHKQIDTQILRYNRLHNSPSEC